MQLSEERGKHFLLNYHVVSTGSGKPVVHPPPTPPVYGFTLRYTYTDTCMCTARMQPTAHTK